MDAMTYLAKALKDRSRKVREYAVQNITTVVHASPRLGVEAMTYLAQALNDDD